MVHDQGMNLSDLRDAPDTAGDLAAATRRYVSDISLPDVSVPKVSRSDLSIPSSLDVDVADLAGNAVEFVGEAAGVVVAQSGRGLAQAIRAVRENPKATIGAIAVVVLVLGLLAARRRSSEPSLESIS